MRPHRFGHVEAARETVRHLVIQIDTAADAA
jgi:hypothetical protein